MNSDRANHHKNYYLEVRGQEVVFADHNGVCTTNDLIPLPLASAAQHYYADTSNGIYDIPLFDSFRVPLGHLCLCRRLTNDFGEVPIATITDSQFAAYINEVAESGIGHPFRFKCDYVVIYSNRLTEYVSQYMESSTVWGGFCHENTVMMPPQSYKEVINSINVTAGITFPTTHHRYTAIRSTMEPYGFERFLKLYHLFELIFDSYTVNKIKSLNDDLHGIGKILSNYHSDELNKFKEIIRELCTETNKIADLLNVVNSDVYFKNTSKAIFFGYDKKGWTLKDKDEYLFERLLSNGGFTLPSIIATKVPNISRDEDGLAKFVIETAAYWLYRIRCCIAHNRIGEYVMREQDERFVVQLAEPLLRELLRQALTNPNL